MKKTILIIVTSLIVAGIGLGINHQFNTKKMKKMKVSKKIEKGVTTGYQKIEDGVVSGYKAIENSVVSGYKAVENKFVETFLTEEENSEEEKEQQS